MGASVARMDQMITDTADLTTYAAAFVSGVEVTDPAYSRILINNISGASPAWTVPAQDPDDNSYRKTDNNAPVTFAAATENWGTVDEIRIMDAATAGNLIWTCTDISPKTINTNDILAYASNNIRMRMKPEGT